VTEVTEHSVYGKVRGCRVYGGGHRSEVV
jgi:hypothetical protein